MGLKSLKPSVKITITNPRSAEGSSMGPGIAALLEGVRETGSLNAAAKRMHMAYSKAWRIVRETETAVGFEVLSRDGAHGSTLTKQGEKLLDAYWTLVEQVQKKAEEAFKKLV